MRAPVLGNTISRRNRRRTKISMGWKFMGSLENALCTPHTHTHIKKTGKCFYNGDKWLYLQTLNHFFHPISHHNCGIMPCYHAVTPTVHVENLWSVLKTAPHFWPAPQNTCVHSRSKIWPPAVITTAGSSRHFNSFKNFLVGYYNVTRAKTNTMYIHWICRFLRKSYKRNITCIFDKCYFTSLGY